MLIAGIDFSLNSTGITIIDTQSDILKFISVNRLKHTKKNKEVFDTLPITEVKILDKANTNELSKINDAIILTREIFTIVKNCDFVAIEGLSFNSQGNRKLELAGYQYLLRYLLYINSIKFDVIPPKTVKKFVGNGNLNKQDMIAKFLYEKNELSMLLNDNKCFKPIDDIVDSYWIAKYAKTFINDYMLHK